MCKTNIKEVAQYQSLAKDWYCAILWERTTELFKTSAKQGDEIVDGIHVLTVELQRE